MQIQIVLVSDQLLPNLIPALMNRPDHVMLVASKDMVDNNKARRLEKLLQEAGIKTQIQDGSPSTGLEDIRAYSQGLAAELSREHVTADIILNATGGTKLMSMAFVDVFREVASRIIYTDTEHDVIETLFPADQPPEPIRNVLDVPTYLIAQGMKYRKAASDDREWIERATARKVLTKYLASEVEKLDSFFGALNGIIHGNKDSEGALTPDNRQLINPCQWFAHRPRGRWSDAMQNITDAGLVEWKGKDEFQLRDRDAALYLGGFWLEEYAWHVARDCQLHDSRCGVEVTWEGVARKYAPRNEFDLLIVYNNRILVVECKTSRLDQDTQNSGQNIVTKLESLGRNAGGTFGGKLLLSARPVTDTIRNRCMALSIPLREQGAIKSLRKNLLAWKNGIAFK